MKRLFRILSLILLLAPHKASADWGTHLGGHFGYGSMGNQGSDLNQSRSIGSFDLQAMPGIRPWASPLLLGLLVQYGFLSQLSNNATLLDYSGRNFTLGPGLLLDLPFVKFIFSYDLRDRHYYSKPDTTLKGSGFHFLFGYKVAAGLCVDAEYVTARYNAVNVGDVETGLTDLQAVHFHEFGFGLSWTY